MPWKIDTSNKNRFFFLLSLKEIISSKDSLVCKVIFVIVVEVIGDGTLLFSSFSWHGKDGKMSTAYKGDNKTWKFRIHSWSLKKMVK